MRRLCERPGCSEFGTIGYGFDADRLLVWLTRRDPDGAEDVLRGGVLCRRHADAMVVPQGWTLDDRRDATPRLFRPPTAPSGLPTPPRAPRRRRRTPPVRTAAVAAAPATMLPIDDVVGDGSLDDGALDDGAPDDGAPDDGRVTVAEVTGAPSTADDPDATVAIPWVPEFDITDDLEGVLRADTPLLARAFRGLDRPR